MHIISPDGKRKSDRVGAEAPQPSARIEAQEPRSADSFQTEVSDPLRIRVGEEGIDDTPTTPLEEPDGVEAYIEDLSEAHAVSSSTEPHEFKLPDNIAQASQDTTFVRDFHFETEKLSRKELKQLSKEEQLAYQKAIKTEKRRHKRSKRKTPIWQIITLLIGLGLLAYPIIADRISAYQADQAITSYTQEVIQDPAVINQKLDEAQAYNDRLSGTPSTYTGVIPEQDQLIVPGGAVFAWIEFPTLSEKLPIFHGTSEDSLQAGVGHLERTSMPIGGNSTHAVLTGHSGMPGSRMFDDIDRLEIGDVFMIHILNQDLAYKVISTEVVWPDEVESLAIQPGKDLCTLITCTPYGVNDHRLLVHAERTSYDEALSLPSNNMMLFFNQRTIPFIIAIIITVLFFVMLTIHRRRRHPLELGVDKAWNGLSDYTDDRRRFIGYGNSD